MDKDTVQAWVTHLLSPEARQAVVQDGWPEAMVEDGFELHRHTWDVSRIQAEVQRLGGQPVQSVAHIWPALPGAGVTPVLYAALAGVAHQYLRPSSRLQNFCAFAAQHILNIQDWTQADRVIVSGSDDTLAAVRLRTHAHVVGYGHRVSLAVVQQGHADAPAIAHDIVMWHQQGCFSPRAVLWTGNQNSAQEFAQELAEQIAHHETRWHARPTSLEAVARRMQARGTQELQGPVWGPGFGFTYLAKHFDGTLPSPHSIPVIVAETLPQALDRVQVPPHQLQGASLSCSKEVRDEWTRTLIARGFTRVCPAGDLQAPPPEWPHDGRPNQDVYSTTGTPSPVAPT